MSAATGLFSSADWSGCWLAQQCKADAPVAATTELGPPCSHREAPWHCWLVQQCKADAPVAATTERGPPCSHREAPWHCWLAQQCKADAPVAATTERGPPDSLETRAGRAQVSLQQPICTRFPTALVQAADEHFAQGGQIGYPTAGQCLLELGQGVQQALDHFRAT